MIQRHDLKFHYENIFNKRFLNMHEEMCEAHPIMQTVMAETWDILTEEERKKVAVMRMDIIIQWLEVKINNMEKMIELKKKAISDIRKVQEMLK
jgi:roadblock/LC7 domain-containing protein